METSTLSPRQSEIAALASEGLTNREIADQLFLSEETIKTHMKGLLRKLGIARRAGIAYALLRQTEGSLPVIK